MVQLSDTLRLRKSGIHYEIQHKTEFWGWLSLIDGETGKPVKLTKKGLHAANYFGNVDELLVLKAMDSSVWGTL